MKCHRVRTLLPDYLGDELSADQQWHVDEHLEGCPACRRELKRLQAVWEGLAQQPLPEKEEGFWQEFSQGVMAGMRKQGSLPPQGKRAFISQGWRILIPAAAMAVLIIVSLIVFRGGLQEPLGPERGGPAISLGEHETIAEIARTFSVAPLAADEEDPFDRGMGLQGIPLLRDVPGISLNPTDMATITEVLTQLSGEEDIYGSLEGFTRVEQEEFSQLLSSQYPSS